MFAEVCKDQMEPMYKEFKNRYPNKTDLRGVEKYYGWWNEFQQCVEVGVDMSSSRTIYKHLLKCYERLTSPNLITTNEFKYLSFKLSKNLS